jgi:UDP-glucose 4-epimerase
MLEGKNVLITGGCGFLGSHLAERLCEKNNVRILDNLSGGSIDNIKGFREKVQLIRVEITDPGEMMEHFKGIDIAYHLAADVNVQRSIEEPAHTMTVNVVGTNAVLEAASKAGVKRVIFTSSASVYGDGEIPVKEEQKTRPISVYGLTKESGEEICRMYNSVFRFPVVVLRLMNMYGPRQKADSPYSGVISLFARKIKDGEPVTIYGDGEQTRDFLYVTDAVEALILAAEKDVAGKTINIGTGKETSLNRLVDLLGKITGKSPQVIHAPLRKGDIVRSYADISLARELLGFSPSVSIEDGLRQLV